MAVVEHGFTNQGTYAIFFKNAKVDPTYSDVLLPTFFADTLNTMCQARFGATAWISQAIQYNYIRPEDKKIKIDLTKYNKGVQGFIPNGIAHPTGDDFIECNYMCFRNSANHSWSKIDDTTDPPTHTDGTEPALYPVRWYFAFITDVQYVNDRVLEISFDIDIFTTYWLTPTDGGNPFNTGEQYKQHFLASTVIHPCFVERESSNTDVIGENYEDEGLDTGDYIVAGDLLDLFGTWQVLVMASERLTNETPPSTEPPLPQTFANIYTPVAIYAGLNASQPQMIQEIIDAYTELGKADSIINVVEYPSSFGTNQIAETVEPTVTMPTTIDGYTPKNKKLFIYPFNFLEASNRSGVHATFKWELWKNASRGKFKRYSCAIGNPTAILVPQDYRGITGDDYESSIMWQKSPVCPYNSDAYKAYWAQNKNQLNMAFGANVLSGLTGLVSTGIGIAMGNPLAILGGGAATVGSLTGVTQKLAKLQDYQAVPDQAKGQINNDYIMAGKNLQGFQVFKMQIRANKARIIDDYFTAYGYATNKVKTPNFYSGSTRTKFCYIKTQGAKVSGNFPAPVKAEFERILDRGVRFWKAYATYLDLTSNPIGS